MADRSVHPGGSGRAGMLWQRAHGLLLEAVGEDDPQERFRVGYLGALRGAGAVLALTGADAAPRARSRNAWVMLQRAAPEFVMWADYFSGHSATRAALEAGLPRDIDAARADEFCARVGAFLHDIEDLVVPATRLRASGDGPGTPS